MINSTNNNHKNIKIRTTVANIVDMGLSSNQNKYRLNKKPCYIRWSVTIQILLYPCKILPTTKGDKEKIRVLERRILLGKYVTKKKHTTKTKLI